MYYLDPRLQYPVRVDKPNPLFAKMLQQAIGGVEGEIRVCSSILFPGMGDNEVPKVSRYVAANRNRGNRAH